MKNSNRPGVVRTFTGLLTLGPALRASVNERTSDTIAGPHFTSYPLRVPSDRDEELAVAEEAF